MVTGPSPLARSAQVYRDHLTVERGLAPNSLAAYSRDLRRYLEFCASRGITAADQVTESDLGDFLAWLRQGSPAHPPLAAASAARTLVAVRGFHRFAVQEGISATDPGREVKPPSAARRLPKALTVDEVEAILTSTGGVAAGPLGLRDRALLEFLYGTGARISEAVGLDVDDLDVDNGVAHLHGKGGKQRLVPIGSKAREALTAYLVRARPGLVVSAQAAVFLNARGGRLSRQSAWTILRTTAERAGVTAEVLAAHDAPLVRHPSPRRGRGRPGRPGAARPRIGHDHAGVHEGHRRAPARGLRPGPPPRPRLSRRTPPPHDRSGFPTSDGPRNG